MPNAISHGSTIQNVKENDSLVRIPLWLGIVIRLSIIYLYPNLFELLDGRVEVNTPLTSYKNMQEGLHLFSNGLSPYHGSVYHQPPLLLILYSYVPKIIIPLMFILIDYVIAYAIIEIAKSKIKHQLNEIWPEPVVLNNDNDDNDNDHHNSKELDVDFIGETIEEEDSVFKNVCKDKSWVDPLEEPTLIPTDPTRPVDLLAIPSDIGVIYLLSPLSILSCISRSSELFSNLGIALGIMFAIKGSRRLSMFFIAFATYFSLYPIVLIAPCVLLLKDCEGAKSNTESIMTGAIKCACQFIAYFSGLLILSFLVFGDWEFMQATYGSIIFVPNLRPNIGLYWYFFMEVFDQFRLLFISIFHLNTYIFTIPICIRFRLYYLIRQTPIFATFLVLMFVGMFKSYPSIADMTLTLPFLMMHPEIIKYSPHMYVSISGLLYACVLGPLFFNTWVYAGSGNANFFYATTLVWNGSLVILIVDLIYSQIKREFERAYPGWRKMRIETVYKVE